MTLAKLNFDAFQIVVLVFAKIGLRSKEHHVLFDAIHN
jgi:hypothetical protein